EAEVRTQLDGIQNELLEARGELFRRESELQAEQAAHEWTKQEHAKQLESLASEHRAELESREGDQTFRLQTLAGEHAAAIAAAAGELERATGNIERLEGELAEAQKLHGSTW